MGGSFSLAVKSRLGCSTFGIDINPEAIKKGKELGVIDEGSTQMLALKDFEPDLVVLAVPVGAFEQVARGLKEVLDEKVLITDLGSVKGRLVYMMEDFFGEHFVGGHPIAGTEKSGVQYSNPELFKNKRVVLTPTERTDRLALQKVKLMWEKLDAFVEFMDPFVHDVVFGAVSHLPHAVAFALMDAMENLSKKTNIDLFLYPGGGFRDFTRIAASDPVMWRDIFLENRENLLWAIDEFIQSLEKLKGLIEEGKKEELIEYLQRAREHRLRID
jgi:prephenate dehydrogenase